MRQICLILLVLLFCACTAPRQLQAPAKTEAAGPLPELPRGANDSGRSSRIEALVPQDVLDPPVLHGFRCWLWNPEFREGNVILAEGEDPVPSNKLVRYLLIPLGGGDRALHRFFLMSGRATQRKILGFMGWYEICSPIEPPPVFTTET